MGELTFAPIRLLSEEDSLEGFSSGNADNDSWLVNRARRAMKNDTARVYVLTTPEGTLVGYYSLSAHAVARSNELPGAMRRNVPDPIPCTLLGQLAVDVRFQGKSAGARLLQDAVKRSITASKIVASKALVVDAADETAAQFYRHFGFKDYRADFKLYIPLP